MRFQNQKGKVSYRFYAVKWLTARGKLWLFKFTTPGEALLVSMADKVFKLRDINLMVVFIFHYHREH